MTIERWYNNYWAQTWYRNTFLVNRPSQIGRAITGDREWNSVKDSGCNFTCLSMILGIDPARLASELGSYSFFKPDRGISAKKLTGKQGGLVWDQNAPNKGTLLKLKNIWNNQTQLKENVSIILEDIYYGDELKYANEIIADARETGRHVICGPETHSHLVAGRANGEFFLWDPNPKDESDDGTWPLSKILSGEVTLKRLFETHKGKKIEFWRYKVTSQ